MGSDYEDTLRGFAEGKRLGRLAKAVRDPEEGVCDACGSALPRTLFGLKDTASGRCYFVGQNCLAWLLETGLVARARYRQSAEVAYRQEMELRRNGAGSTSPEPSPSTGSGTDLHGRKAGPPVSRRTMIIIGSNSHYEALARLDDGRRSVSGRALEPRWRQEWGRHEGAVVLEPVCRPRRAALALCVLRAYGQALALWRDGDGLNGREKGETIHEGVKACSGPSKS